jgi:hypothetical protein
MVSGACNIFHFQTPLRWSRMKFRLQRKGMDSRHQNEQMKIQAPTMPGGRSKLKWEEGK